jgi:hypothetical protein
MRPGRFGERMHAERVKAKNISVAISGGDLGELFYDMCSENRVREVHHAGF